LSRQRCIETKDRVDSAFTRFWREVCSTGGIYNKRFLVYGYTIEP